MCYAKPGPRCAHHTKNQLTDVLNELADTSDLLQRIKVRKAMWQSGVEYASTSQGCFDIYTLMLKFKNNKDEDSLKIAKKLYEEGLYYRTTAVTEYNATVDINDQIGFRDSLYDLKSMKAKYDALPEEQKKQANDAANEVMGAVIDNSRSKFIAEEMNSNIPLAYKEFVSECGDDKGVDWTVNEFIKAKRKQNVRDATQNIENMNSDEAKKWFDDPKNAILNAEQAKILYKIKSYVGEDRDTYNDEVDRLKANGITFDSAYISSPKRENFLEGVCLGIAERNLLRSLKDESDGKYELVRVSQLSQNTTLGNIRFTANGNIIYTQKEYADSKIGKESPSSKSLDSIIILRQDNGDYHVFLATQKHADSHGGSQNNQFNDAIKTIDNMKKALADEKMKTILENRVKGEWSEIESDSTLHFYPSGLLDGKFMRKQSEMVAATYPEFTSSDKIVENFLKQMGE